MLYNWFDKKITCGTAVIAVCVGMLAAMGFGMWAGSPDKPSPYGKNAPLMEGSDYQSKYAREVCKQRNATPHSIV